MASSEAAISREGTGFNFDYVHRNTLLTRRGVQQPTQRSTGTTLAGLIFKAQRNDAYRSHPLNLLCILHRTV